MYTSLTTTFVAAINDGDYAAELVTQATSAGTPIFTQATLTGYITPGGTAEDDKAPADHSLYGLVILAVIPIAAVTYAMYGSGAMINEKEERVEGDVMSTV